MSDFRERILKYENRESWNADRFNSVGASETPAIIGVECELEDGSVFSSPYALWAQKRHLVKPPDLSGNAPVQSGIHLEGGILNWYRRERGQADLVSLDPWPQTHRVYHEKHEYWRCTMDALQYLQCGGDPLLSHVSAKNVSQWVQDKWMRGAPIPYQIQLQAEMAITGLTHGTIVACIGGQKLVWFDYERDSAFIANITRCVETFWDMVVSGKQPEIDGTIYTADALSEQYKKLNRDQIKPLPFSYVQTVALLEKATEERKKMEKAEAALENQLKAAVGEAGQGQLPNGWLVSWLSDVNGKRRFRVKKGK